MNESLPPKTCSIERLITLEEDIERVLSGAKTSTRRNGRYADPGEIMELKGRKLQITRVYQQALGELTEENVQSEGFESLDAYKSYILGMHKGMPWIPSAKVWVHEFQLID
jgi:N4-acetylcytidine amidohydrolase